MVARKILENLVLGLVFVVPLIFGNEGWVFNYGFLRLWIVYFVVFLGWLVWAVIVVGEKKIILPQKNFLVGISLWFLSLTISAIFGLSFKDSLIGRYGLWTTSILSYFVFFSLTYFVFFAAKGDSFFKNKLMTSFISSGLVLMSYETVNDWQVLNDAKNGWRMAANSWKCRTAPTPTADRCSRPPPRPSATIFCSRRLSRYMTAWEKLSFLPLGPTATTTWRRFG